MFTLEPGFAMSPHRGPFAGAIRLQVGGLRVAGCGCGCLVRVVVDVDHLQCFWGYCGVEGGSSRRRDTGAAVTVEELVQVQNWCCLLPRVFWLQASFPQL